MPANFSFSGAKITPEGERYLKEINRLVESEIRVGFQSGESSYDDGTDLVAVAAYNEYGTSDTPARPFMKQSFENHEQELRAACENAFKGVSSGGSAETALKQLGVFAKGLIQEEIASGSFEPNKPSTIKKKGSARPLIDTGLMRQSVNYTIKKG